MMKLRKPLKVAGRRGERGIALISVIAVLVLLAMVATPFLLTMRDSAARGEKFLYGERANAEAQALFETVRSELVGTLEHVERRKLDENGAAMGASRVPSDCTPTCDTPDEMTMSAKALERFNTSTAKEHRVWAADIIDTQTLFNLNNCSFPILANILGRAEVTASTTSDKQSIPLSRIPDSFPKQDGVVRIGSECIKYKQIVGNELVNCERGYMGSIAGNGPAHDIDLGDPVMLESCFQIATRPFRVRPGTWVRYTNVEQARTISDLGVTPLLPQDFERLRPFITAWNGNAVGDGWCNPQNVGNGITAGDQTNLYAQIKNIRYFGPGTMVRITDGVNEDFAIVTKLRGNTDVLLAGRIDHTYTADQTRIYCLARSPINVNTADVATLALVFDGLKMLGKTGSINTRQAEDLAVFLKSWRPKVPQGMTAPPVPPPAGVFRDWEELTRALEDARDAGKIDQDGFEAVLRNAMNANDSSLGYSTVPFVFRSYDTYEVRATVSLQGAQGRELARRELRRLMEVSTTRSATFVLETQDEFQNQIIKSRDSKWMSTYPVNVNSHYDGKNIPASEYQAYANKNLFPSNDRSSGVGDVELLPAAYRMLAGNRKDSVIHFDDQRIPDGYPIENAPYTLSVDTPYDPAKGTLDLVDMTSIDGYADNIELGMKEFTCSFWYRPDWDRDNSEHFIFDYGLDSDFMDRVSLRYDPADGGALVLAACDATREQRAAEVRYKFDHGTWKAKEWYHIAVEVHGCGPGMLDLFVDGEKQGTSNVQTRLTSGMPGTGTGGGESLQVESTKGFPDTGVLLLRGKDGIELMEYSSKQDTSFTISRRKARSIDHAPTDTVARAHNEGDTVELYGCTAPLLCDLKKGGATLDTTIGPWRVYRFHYTGDTCELAGTPSVQISRGLANPANASAAVTGIRLTDWDTDSSDPGILDDLGPQGTEGIAMIISALYGPDNPTSAPMRLASGNTNGTAQEPQSIQVGGIEFVRYQVEATTGQVTIPANGRNLKLKHAATAPGSDGLNRFIPTYSYGDTAGEPLGSSRLLNGNGSGGTQTNGALTAFIPISLAGGGTNAQYLNPTDEEPQLPGFSSNGVVSRRAYVQIDGEWVSYDTFDATGSLTSGKLLFYRDMTSSAVANIASSSSGTATAPFGGAGNVLTISATSSNSSGQGGGTGGNAGNDAPPPATEYNDEGNPPTEATAANNSLPTPPVQSVEIARALDFRGYEKRSVQWEYRVANTVPRDHTGGIPIMPSVYVVAGNNLEQRATQNDGAVFAFPGFNDLITMRDKNGNDEQLRVQWGYKGWWAPTTAPIQSWNWDRPQGSDGNAALRRWDSRAWTRALKFPSGEMPDGALTKASESIVFGKKYDKSGGVSTATIDEIAFWNFKRPQLKDRPAYTFLGTVPPEVADPNVAAQQAQSGTPPVPVSYVGIDDKADQINVHLPVLDSSGQVLYPYGTPVDPDTYSKDGGIIKIDDELILFEEFDAGQGKFTNCVRGAFGTDPKPHQYEARVVPFFAYPTSRLTAAIDTSTASYQIEDTSDFADDGYIRIGLNSEIIGYTYWEVGNLTAPLARLDPAKDNTPRDPNTAKKNVAGSIFRGRFGTVPQAANAGEIAVAMPFRVYDRYAERADDPEQSYLQASWTRHGAIFKRISWDELPMDNIDIQVLLRFSGGPPWDSDKIVHVGQDLMPTDDRRQYLYQLSDPTAPNTINVEADRIEVRIGVRFGNLAYDRTAQIAPDSWKETPAIRKLVVEYVAPPQVLSQE